MGSRKHEEWTLAQRQVRARSDHAETLADIPRSRTNEADTRHYNAGPLIERPRLKSRAQEDPTTIAQDNTALWQPSTAHGQATIHTRRYASHSQLRIDLDAFRGANVSETHTRAEDRDQGRRKNAQRLEPSKKAAARALGRLQRGQRDAYSLQAHVHVPLIPSQPHKQPRTFGACVHPTQRSALSTQQPTRSLVVRDTPTTALCSNLRHTDYSRTYGLPHTLQLRYRLPLRNASHPRRSPSLRENAAALVHNTLP